MGLNAGVSLTTGGSNVLLGPNTGAGLTTESNIVEIGNGTLKAPAADDVIVGNSTSAQCYIGGIAGVAVGGTPQMVTVNPVTKQIGSTAVPSSGVLSLGPIGASSNANGATITGTVLNLEPASSSFGGVVTVTNQSWAGVKTFTGAVNLFATSSLNVGVLQQSGGRLLHTFGTNNTFVGADAGNFTLSGDRVVCLGGNAGLALTTGNQFVAIGHNAGTATTTGGFGICIGTSAGGGQTTALNNVIVGPFAGFGLTTGGGNTFVGASAGFASAATCANAIELSNGTMGTCITGDIRIGTSSSLACYIAALSPTIAAPTSMVVYDSATRQVGSASLSNVSTNITATLDAGAITTMTVRGAATTKVPIRCSLLNNVVTMRIPYFTISVQTMAAATVNLGTIPAQFRPTYQSWFPLPVINNAGGAMAVIYVTSGGLVSLQLLTGAAFVLPMGPIYDVNVNWNIGA